MNRIVLHVDRLVLRGVRTADRRAVAEALRETLAAALVEPGVATSLGALGHLEALRVPAVHAPGDRGPRALGRAAAGGIAGSLGR